MLHLSVLSDLGSIILVKMNIMSTSLGLISRRDRITQVKHTMLETIHGENDRQVLSPRPSEVTYNLPCYCRKQLAEDNRVSC